MNHLAKIKRQALFAAAIVSPLLAFASDNIRIESAVIFNTSCARCHEGQCSGRLSFHLPKDATDQHIRRYGGELSLETTRQLFELLRYMKEECSFYPFSLALAEDRVWDSDTLTKLQAPSKQAYFMPLGYLDPGLYQLLFEGLNVNIDACIEIIDREFNFIGKDDVDREDENKKTVFQANERSEYFLRITAREPISLTRVELVTISKDSTSESSKRTR